MTGAQAARLSGDRLHLHQGPIDLVIHADGAREAAYAAATARFTTVLDELVAELPRLRASQGARIESTVGMRMARAIAPHAPAFVTPMAAVAGAVADEVLAHTCTATPLRRAYVNNGGDIALHLNGGESFRVGLAALDGIGHGTATIGSEDGIGGIATSGFGGRSLSFGIAEAVTVLASKAADADAAATLIANAVDLPDHPAISRVAAHTLDPDSDLGERLVVKGCGPLGASDIARALEHGLTTARAMQAKGLIRAAHLRLRGQTATLEQTETELARA